MNASKKILSELREELSSERNRWEEIQVEWAPSYAKPSHGKSFVSAKSTYLSHVMADDFTGNSTGNSCMFHAALKQMTPPEPSVRIPKNGGVSQDVLGGSLVLNGDKFSTELAGLDPTDSKSPNMTDFSRFLFFLAGEAELANAPDPARVSQRNFDRGDSLTTMKDRLIR